MPVPVVILVEFTCSLIALSLVARWYIAPMLVKLSPKVALPPLILIHMVRPVSLWLLVPGVIVQPTIPASFATGTAYGDLLAAGLALVAALLVRGERPGAIAATWIFNLVGLGDALKNCGVGMLTRAPAHMGAGVLIPAYGVPVLLVSHGLIFYLLLRPRQEQTRISR
jgi:hypothetical protein